MKNADTRNSTMDNTSGRIIESTHTTPKKEPPAPVTPLPISSDEQIFSTDTQDNGGRRNWPKVPVIFFFNMSRKGNLKCKPAHSSPWRGTVPTRTTLTTVKDLICLHAISCTGPSAEYLHPYITSGGPDKTDLPT